MTDTNNQRRSVNIYRRNALLSGAAWFSLCSTATVSLASDGGGGRDPSPTSDSTKSKKIVKYSQSEFRKLSKKELLNLNDQISFNEITLKITGFSKNMAEWLIFMAYFDRVSTSRVIRDLAKLKTEKTRKARLQAEIKRLTKLENLLKSSIKRLKAKKGSKDAIKAERTRLYAAKKYKRGIKNWLEVPFEGTFK